MTQAAFRSDATILWSVPFGQCWRHLLRLARSVAASALLLTGVGAQAQALTANDEQQIIATVQAQLDAFAQDDAEKAFSFAAPNIRMLMGNADYFLALVRGQYRVVYRPASVAFIKPQGQRDSAVLRVQMTDSDGDAWIATYGLQRQSDATWRITGCTLSPAGAGMI